MDRQFFEDLGLTQPRYHLEEVRNYSSHAAQTAEMMKGIEEALFTERPEFVLVCGDANTNLSGALTARKLGLKVGHVEAGLRSHDWRMPEEHNRVIMDHICELLFPPTEGARENLIREHVRGRIFVTGNTVADAVVQHMEIANQKSDILSRLNLPEKGFFLLTMHREENVDNEQNLEKAIAAIELVASRYPGVPIIFPIHPRTTKRLSQSNLMDRIGRINALMMIEPVGYLDFLVLISRASLILTDSGGIQEEACILKTPCVTLRENTERPESVTAGANILAGLAPEAILSAVNDMVHNKSDWTSPFGDGKASERIVNVVESALRREIDLSEFEN
jgi:UDP-N-acetylglucosamine 2-epimerase (non-hydrolysing)